jgi:hypothetical protein
MSLGRGCLSKADCNHHPRSHTDTPSLAVEVASIPGMIHHEEIVENGISRNAQRGFGSHSIAADIWWFISRIRESGRTQRVESYIYYLIFMFASGVFHSEVVGSAHAFLQQLAARAKQVSTSQQLQSVLPMAIQGLPLPKACTGCAVIVSKGRVSFVSIGELPQPSHFPFRP